MIVKDLKVTLVSGPSLGNHPCTGYYLNMSLGLKAPTPVQSKPRRLKHVCKRFLESPSKEGRKYGFVGKALDLVPGGMLHYS